MRAGFAAVLDLDGDAASAAQRRAVLADSLMQRGDDAVRVVLGLHLEPTIGALAALVRVVEALDHQALEATLAGHLEHLNHTILLMRPRASRLVQVVEVDTQRQHCDIVPGVHALLERTLLGRQVEQQELRGLADQVVGQALAAAHPAVRVVVVPVRLEARVEFVQAGDLRKLDPLRVELGQVVQRLTRVAQVIDRPALRVHDHMAADFVMLDFDPCRVRHLVLALLPSVTLHQFSHVILQSVCVDKERPACRTRATTDSGRTRCRTALACTAAGQRRTTPGPQARSSQAPSC